LEARKAWLKKPASRIRYEETHPVIGVRLSMDDYRRLKEMKEEDGSAGLS